MKAGIANALARFRLAVAPLLCGLSLCIPNAPAAQTETKPMTCVHLLRGGRKYSLSYFGLKCTQEGYVPLPEEHFDALASWAINASHARILSQFDRYRMLARLSTLDTRGEKGFACGPCAFGPWADYKWADHAGHAFYGVSDCLGKTPIVTDSLVKPLVKSGLARKDRDSILEFKESKKLSNPKRSSLVRVFSDAENSLSEEKLLLAVPRTLDEAAKEKPKHENARRETLGQFTLTRD